MSVADLRKANHTAWDAYRALVKRFGMHRTPQQEQAIHEAHKVAEWAAWKLETAKFWEKVRKQ